MRTLIATAAFVCLTSALPAAAATCPGNLSLNDTFTSLNPGWNPATAATVKVTIGSGKADIAFTQQGLGQSLQYSNIQYGDVSVCATVGAPATGKAEDEAAGITFWGTSPTSYYMFEVTTSGQFFVGSNNQGTWTPLFARQASAAITKGVGVTNAIQVTTKGNLATFYVNGQQVGTITGVAPSGGGTVGMYAESSTTSPETLDFSSYQIAVP